MENNKFESAPQDMEITFKRSFRGYNTVEVDQYIESLLTDIEALKAESADYQKKYEDSNKVIEQYKRTENERNIILTEAKGEADMIVKDAKSRAARVIMRTSRQCNRIVSDMVAQVEEQKNIYEATKKEVVRFRSALFGEYTDHIKKINAFVEAAGGMDGDDEMTDEEINGFMEMLSDSDSSGKPESDEKNDGGEDEAEDELVIAEELREAVEKITEKKPEIPEIKEIKKEQITEVPAEEKQTELPAVEPDKTREQIIEEERKKAEFGNDDLFDEFGFDGRNDENAEAVPDEKDETVADNGVSEDEYGEESFSKALNDLRKTVKDADPDFEESPKDDDGDPVSVSDVFGNMGNYFDPDDEEEDDLWGIMSKTGTFIIPDEIKSPEPERDNIHQDASSNSYGFDVANSLKDEDDDEFYHETDAEYDPDGEFSGVETAASTESLAVPPSSAPIDPPARWRIKKSMSLTDEFDAIKAENDD